MNEATYLVRHTTAYTYSEPAQQSHNLACLLPRDYAEQSLDASKVLLSPEPQWRNEWRDIYGNHRHSFSLSVPHETLEVTLLAKLTRRLSPPPDIPRPWEDCVLPDGALWSSPALIQREFRFPSPQLPALNEPGFDCDDCFAPGRPVLAALDAFMTRIHGTFTYDPKATTTFTPLAEVYKKKAGVCQDFAHAAIAELRRRGFAAGYVSGYLETVPPPGREKLRGADATHAWYAVYLPGHGWIHFDPTNNSRAGLQHLITAWGRDYGDVAPLKGVLLGGGAHTVKVAVDVFPWPDQVPEDLRNVF
ncbi:MAG: transglutaminase family protein [Verrucomicrobia bacterium]|nr:transglutaminase family protein [Verrucomicrobiota bacterium]MCH8525830.1 transglutaminase family protein [Kiritimatiellia bacterium]